jgi:MFS family permease
MAGIASFKMVHDFPDQAKVLSVQDLDRVIFRLAEDKQSIGRREEFSLTYLCAALKDFKTFLGMGIFMGSMMALYSIGLFLPTIISNLSLTRPDDVVRNQLLTVPPYAVATVVTVAAGFFSDRKKRRGVYNMSFAVVGTVGFLMLAVSTNPGVQYAGTFFGTAGVYASIAITVAWVANNVEGVYKRGIVMGLVIGWGNLNDCFERPVV